MAENFRERFYIILRYEKEEDREFKALSSSFLIARVPVKRAFQGIPYISQSKIIRWNYSLKQRGRKRQIMPSLSKQGRTRGRFN